MSATLWVDWPACSPSGSSVPAAARRSSQWEARLRGRHCGSWAVRGRVRRERLTTVSRHCKSSCVVAVTRRVYSGTVSATRGRLIRLTLGGILFVAMYVWLTMLSVSPDNRALAGWVAAAAGASGLVFGCVRARRQLSIMRAWRAAGEPISGWKAEPTTRAKKIEAWAVPLGAVGAVLGGMSAQVFEFAAWFWVCCGALFGTSSGLMATQFYFFDELSIDDETARKLGRTPG